MLSHLPKILPAQLRLASLKRRTSRRLDLRGPSFTGGLLDVEAMDNIEAWRVASASTVRIRTSVASH